MGLQNHLAFLMDTHQTTFVNENFSCDEGERDIFKHKHKVSPILLKVDFVKAFDISWDFLYMILRSKEFGLRICLFLPLLTLELMDSMLHISFTNGAHDRVTPYYPQCYLF